MMGDGGQQLEELLKKENRENNKNICLSREDYFRNINGKK